MDQKKDHKNKIVIVILAIVVALIVVFAVVQSNGQKANKKSTSSNSITKKKSIKSSSSKISVSSNQKVKSTVKKGKLLKKEPTMAQFNKIKVADPSNPKDKKGSKLKDLERKLGKPTNLTINKVGNVTSAFANWTYNRKSTTDSISLSISFNNHQAISKAIIGFKVDRPKKIGLPEFNKIKDGSTYEQIVKELGEPNGITESVSKNKTFKTAIYSSNLNTNFTNKNNSNVTFVFVSGKLTAKNQTGLK